MSNDIKSKILKFIVDYVTENGYPPTVREICEGVNHKSTSSVHNHLKAMRLIGMIEGEVDKPRAIRVPGYKFVKEEDNG